jgi:glycosyltransferase involved in cell wall biosynthesis
VRSDFVDDKASSGFFLGRLSARWPSKQIYNSFAAAEKARNFRTFFAPRQVFVVQNRLDLQRFRKIPLSTNGQVRILGVGSLLQYKRWDRLLRAALDLKQRGLHFLVEIAGGGPLRESLERQARDLEITDRVRFAGHADDVPGLMATSTFLAHTSDVEGCPNVVMEAMACGRAVVAMAAGDIPSLVEDGKTGFVVPRGDDAQFVERLATLITNRELGRQMGEAGRVKAEREFGLHRLAEETLNAYRQAGWRGL